MAARDRNIGQAPWADAAWSDVAEGRVRTRSRVEDWTDGEDGSSTCADLAAEVATGEREGERLAVVRCDHSTRQGQVSSPTRIDRVTAWAARQRSV